MAIEDYYRPLLVSHTGKALDAYGDNVTTYSEPRTVPGYIGKPSSKQVVAMGQRGVQVDGRLYAPVEAGVKPFDVITDTQGRMWQVVSDPRDAAGRGHHIEADLKRMLGGAPDAHNP